MLVVFFGFLVFLIGVYGIVFSCLISDEINILEIIFFITIYILGGGMLVYPVSKSNKMSYFIALTISPLLFFFCLFMLDILYEYGVRLSFIGGLVLSILMSFFISVFIVITFSDKEK